MDRDGLELYVVQRKVITSRVLTCIEVPHHNLHLIGIHGRSIYVGVLVPDIIHIVVQVNRIT